MSIARNEIELVIETLSAKKSQGPAGLTGEFSQMVRK